MYRFEKLEISVANDKRKPVLHANNLAGDPVSLWLDDTLPVRKVDTHFLSLSIDISVIAGGVWWEGSRAAKRGLGATKISPLDLYQQTLDHYTRALSPFYLRVGGSEADKIAYLDKGPQDALRLCEQKWAALHDFKTRHNLKLFFTAKYGVFERRQHGNWQPEELVSLLQHSRENNCTIDVMELGNELNAYWIFHGLFSQPGPKKLAEDYVRFAAVVREFFPQAKICGPGSAFWPKLGEAGAPFSNLTRRFLASIPPDAIDILDWHYYPFQSRRSPVRTATASAAAMLKPKALDVFSKYTEVLRQWRDQYQPHCELWTGESGSAQCGGEAGVSDRFASCFWLADQLGLAAKTGHRVMIRQSLVGGDYGLLDRRSLRPRPDYWLSFLWKKLMGNTVIPIRSSDPQLRVYCHADDNGRKTLLLINLARKTKSISVENISDSGCEIEKQYTLSAENLQSDRVMINGVDAEQCLVDLNLDDIPQRDFTSCLTPQTLQFWCLSTP